MKIFAFILLVVSAGFCHAQDVGGELVILRKNYDLAPLVSGADKGSLAFYVFVRPALSDSEYVISGSVRVTEKEIGGSVTLSRPAAKRAAPRKFSLSRSQALEVFSWFSDAKFLDSKVEETVHSRVLDGVELVIECVFEGRHFQLRRNAYDSLMTEGFFRRVEAFRVWKEEPNQSLQPTAPSGRG